MSTAKAAGNTGGFSTMEHKGCTFRIYATTDEHRAAFLRWVHGQVIRRLYETKGEYPDKEFRELRRDVQTDLGTGFYDPGSEGYDRIAQTPEASYAFLKLVIQGWLEEDQLLEFLNDRGQEVQAVLDDINGVSDDDKAPVAANPKA